MVGMIKTEGEPFYVKVKGEGRGWYAGWRGRIEVLKEFNSLRVTGRVFVYKDLQEESIEARYIDEGDWEVV